MSKERAIPRGLYFEDLEIGWKVRTPGRTVTEADIVMFAGLSGDYTPLHTDAEYARGTIFGERIAHGLLGLAIASGLATRLGFLEETVEAFTSLEWRFRAPIRIGDTIHVEIEVAQKRPAPNGRAGFVIFHVEVRNQRGEVVQKGQWTLLVRARGAEGMDLEQR
ncbi:MaoC/PaaZ C-terminal domain-containing protein [Thermoflexus sp.]|uniref:MaoC/PaaZ C-terminal domain-containing protein n=1 Tax=Thermoflexus sp. TaxID=1969742 RepID=UPI0017548327|nr:MaoC/PaaZ C-terminal domain-containing protein [Thermoflexus sp.]